MPNRESEPPQEREPLEPYLKAVSYRSDQTALGVYNRIQAMLFGSSWDLSTYRIRYQDVPHVVVLGSSPPTEGDKEISAMLGAGSPASLPEEVLTYLWQRRADAQRLGPWVERHWRNLG